MDKNTAQYNRGGYTYTVNSRQVHGIAIQQEFNTTGRVLKVLGIIVGIALVGFFAVLVISALPA